MSIASKVLGAGGTKVCRRTKVEVTVGDEAVVFEVRQPTLDDRDKIINEKSVGRQLVEAVIACAIDPDTGGRAFAAEHRDALLSQPAGSWVDDLGKAALELVNPEAALGKGSGATANSSS